MVRVSATIVTVALLAVPAIALSGEKYVRDATEGEPFTREVNDALLVARKEMESVYGRELVDTLEARDPFFGALLGIIARVGARIGSKVASKAASKAKPHKIAKQAYKQHQNNNNNNNNRKHKRDILGGGDYEYEFEREFDDLDVRGFFDDLD